MAGQPMARVNTLDVEVARATILMGLADVKGDSPSARGFAEGVGGSM